MKRGLILLLITGMVSACSLSDGIKSKPIFTGIDLSNLSEYQSIYQVEFQGDFTWRYSLFTYHLGELTESNLHIEGVDPAQNPGDVRLVTDGQTSWMTGSGVDNECYMFPNDFDIGYTFLTPDDIFSPSNISPLLAFESESEKSDLTVKVYSANVPEHNGWRDLNIEMWLVGGGDYPTYYTIKAEGSDPIFDAGVGSFNSTFTIDDDSNHLIEPVTGCEIPFTLPEDAEKVVRFPGLYSFESGNTPEDMATFYQNYLVEKGWREDQPLTGTKTEMQMSFTRGEEVIVFYFKTKDDGVMVEVMLQ